MTIKNLESALHELSITVSASGGSYYAWFDDYDHECGTGWGKSVVAAAADLLNKQNDRIITELYSYVIVPQI